jgi:bacterioferritin-associated ferredoxin
MLNIVSELAVRNAVERRCSFCQRFQANGVGGPTPDVYICPTCIDLVAEILAEHRREAAAVDEG